MCGPATSVRLSAVESQVSLYGGVVQLGEHLPCKQGVSGSIPLVSTIFIMFLENCTQKKKEKPLSKAKAGEET